MTDKRGSRLKVEDVEGRDAIHVKGTGEVTAVCPLHDDTRA